MNAGLATEIRRFTGRSGSRTLPSISCSPGGTGVDSMSTRYGACAGTPSQGGHLSQLLLQRLTSAYFPVTRMARGQAWPGTDVYFKKAG